MLFLGLRIEEKSNYEYGSILHFDSKLIMGRVQVSVLNLFRGYPAKYSVKNIFINAL